MGFRIPDESGARFARRAERARQASEEQERRQNEAVYRRIAQMEFREETRRWRGRMLFDLQQVAETILDRLIEIRDRNAPKNPDAPWNAEFCAAVRVIPEARRFLVETSINMIREKGEP